MKSPFHILLEPVPLAGKVNQPSALLRDPTRIFTRGLLTACENSSANGSDSYIDEVIAWLAIVHSINIVSSQTAVRKRQRY